MSKIKIFIEDKEKSACMNFLSYFCNILGIKIEDNDFFSTRGYTNLYANKPKFMESKDFNQKSLVIFDADKTGINDGGFSNRKKYIEHNKKELGIDFELFLFPNNKDDGCFENLLENIINEKHKCKLDCFDAYEMCLKQYKDDNGNLIYNIPAIKAKMYSYMDTFKMSNKIHEKLKKYNWFFDNSDYWDINSGYLEPLKKFLLDNNN